MARIKHCILSPVLRTEILTFFWKERETPNRIGTPQTGFLKITLRWNNTECTAYRACSEDRDYAGSYPTCDKEITVSTLDTI